MATALELRVEPTPRGEVFAEAPTVRAAVAARMAFSSLNLLAYLRPAGCALEADKGPPAPKTGT